MEPQVASPGAVQLNDNGMSDDRGSRCLSESLSATVANGLEDDNVDRSLNGSLHLAYFAAEITLHRVIIRSLAVLASPENTANNATTSGNVNTGTRAASAVSGLSADTTPAPGPAPTHDLGQYLTYICRSAAKTRLISALDFTNRLRSFGLLLRITAATRSECAFYGRRVGEYVWTLGVSEGWGGEWVGWAGERVRELVDAVNHSNLPEKPDYAPENSNRGGEGMPIGMNVNLGLSNWASGGFGHQNPRLSFGLGINPEDASYVSENEDGVDMEGDEEMDEEMEGADEDINKHGAGENDNRERPVDQDAYDNGQGDINSDRATLDEHSATETTEATMTTAATKTVSTSKTTSAPMTPSLSDEPLFSSSRVPSKGPLSPPTPDHIQPVARHMRFHDRAEPGVSVECMAKLEC
ncbi:Fungal specific transcription factor [Ascosphaera atra]|nr:Fungal specific transcription factor [Ascosphaera atra]